MLCVYLNPNLVSMAIIVIGFMYIVSICVLITKLFQSRALKKNNIIKLKI